MYKLLIVDDEPLVQVGIKSMLNFQELNIEFMGTASNGSIALDMMKADLPDIVITDIKMPVMDGLTLLRESRKLYGYDRPVFLMLTSYEDFSMARESITYQALEYLVKVELTPDSLKNAVLKAVDRLEGLKASRTGEASPQSAGLYAYTEKFMISLLNNLFENEEQMKLQAENLHIDLDFSSFLCCYGSFESLNAGRAQNNLVTRFDTASKMLNELSSKYAHCYPTSLDMSHFALIFCFKDRNPSDDKTVSETVSFINRIRLSLNNYYNIDLKCGVGLLVNNAMALSDSYQYARVSYRRADKDDPVISIGVSEAVPHDVFNISLFKADLTKAFEEYDPGLLCGTVDSLCDLISSHPHHYVQALDAASNILYLSLSLLSDGEQVLNSIFSDSPEGYRSLYKQTSVSQIVTWLKYFASSLAEVFEERRKDYKNRIVIDVKNYISEHISERLTLNEVAAHFAISSGYLSQLFGKYSDSGFTEYINAGKIKEAKRLLKEEHKKVYEVADMLSFGSEFYFSKVFKRVEGITPTEYLNS